MSESLTAASVAAEGVIAGVREYANDGNDPSGERLAKALIKGSLTAGGTYAGGRGGAALGMLAPGAEEVTVPLGATIGGVGGGLLGGLTGDLINFAVFDSGVDLWPF